MANANITEKEADTKEFLEEFEALDAEQQLMVAGGIKILTLYNLQQKRKETQKSE